MYTEQITPHRQNGITQNSVFSWWQKSIIEDISKDKILDF